MKESATDLSVKLEFLEQTIICGQATKGIRRMSRCQETMKDVVGCDKPRQAADKRYSLGFPNGKTHHIYVISGVEYIGVGR